jgi:two-component system, OmpR family, KDP operon response regulator KdpE
MTRVLVVDDEPQLLRALRINLRARHYDVETAPNGAAALAAAARCPPDLVILDLGLPDLDGVQVIEGLRGWTRVPIIVLSGRADPAGKVGALDAGADDYVTKPFHMDELLARVRSALRRSVGGTEVASFTLGHHVIDLAARTITPVEDTSGSSAQSAVTAGGAPAGSAAAAGGAPAGSAATADGAPAGSGAAASGASAGSGAAASDTRPGPVRLTPTEWGVLEILLRNAGKLVPARQLLSEVWGPKYQHETHYLRFYLARLRRKLEPDPSRPRYLINEPGMGYRYEP